ncbi:MAG: transglycosylase SLT domain-containing protein [Alphaproteobacteria bacterium]|nr:transglycosylase SLT domain-containing protein [Alphaproteobacteria bacterium]
MLFLILLIFIQPVQAKSVEKIVDDRFVCVDATAKFEQEFQIKKHLLTTISNVETGKWDESLQKRTTWPWTVNAQGKSFYYASKAEAIREVSKMQRQGIKSIDVGCMQVNLLYHGDAFANLEEAFDPETNVKYGATFLKKLYDNTNEDWMKAATQYHSKKPHKAKRYGNKIAAVYKDIQGSLTTTALNETINSKPTVQEAKVKKIKAQTLKAQKVKNTQNLADRANKAKEWREARLEEYRKSKIK